MKKFFYVLPAMAVLALAGCSTELSDEDRALLTETRDLAMEAREESARASKEAEMAARAAAEAKMAAEEAVKNASNVQVRQNRMFHENTMK